jgi:hypothetical protein
VYVVSFKHFNGTCSETVCVSHFDRKFKFVSVFHLHTNSKLDDSFFFQNFLKKSFHLIIFLYVNWNFLKFLKFKITLNFMKILKTKKIPILSIMKRSKILLLLPISNYFYILNWNRGKIWHIYLTAMDELGWTNLVSLFNLWLKLVTSFSPSY